MPVRLTIFTLPKPFVDEAISRAQLNALRSWRELDPQVEVLLLGDEEGIAETADRERVRHIAGVERNLQGTPLVSSAFHLASRQAQGEVLMYCNADVILQGPLVSLAGSLLHRWPAGFLGLGRRRDVELEQVLDWSQRARVQERITALSRQGRYAARVCKEYFFFRRNQFAELPPFAVGRGNWDNWMVANARRTGWPVVDLSPAIEALHQEHGYAHIKHRSGSRPSRWQCYVTGNEARENERLAGGKWLIRGSSAEWRVTDRGDFVRKRWSQFHLDFWLDLPRFLGLSLRLPFQH